MNLYSTGSLNAIYDDLSNARSKAETQKTEAWDGYNLLSVAHRDILLEKNEIEKWKYNLVMQKVNEYSNWSGAQRNKFNTFIKTDFYQAYKTYFDAVGDLLFEIYKRQQNMLFGYQELYPAVIESLGNTMAAVKSHILAVVDVADLKC